MKIILWMMVLVFAQLQFAYSADLEHFIKRFSFKRNAQGILVAIIDRSLLDMTQNLKARDLIKDL